MSGKQQQPRKAQGQKPKPDARHRPKRHSSNETPKTVPTVQAPKVERPAAAAKIEISRGPGSLTGAPKPAPPVVVANPIQIAPIQVEPPVRKQVELTISVEAQSQIEARKKSHTYSIEQLRAKRHDRELANPGIFQFHAELQLYKRFLAGSRRQRANVVHDDMPVLQHRINSILLQFNVNTFQQVFNEILSLGIESETFVLSYVNVVFKQAVLNPSLSLLFSMLSANVSYVMKHTKFAEKLKELFVERCNESFVVPKADTDRGVLILLRGIVIFAGHLLRDKMLPKELLANWAGKLIQSGTTSALGLLINLLLAGGVTLAEDNKAVLDQLSEKMKDSAETELIEPYGALMDLLHGAVQPTEQSDRELKTEEMKKSPSVDKELDGKYGSLFKKSGSIPVELSQLAGDEGEDESMSSLVTQYFYSTELGEFLEGLERLKYEKGDVRTAIDLLRAVVEQPHANQMVVSGLVVEMLLNGYYGEEHLRSAIQAVAKEFAASSEKGKKMMPIYAQLLNGELVTFDEFEQLFGEMRSVWREMIQTLFVHLDQLKGDWIDDLLESEYWRNVRFLGVDSIVDKLARLQEWELLSFLPQYDIAASFLESAKADSLNVDFVAQDDSNIDKQEIAPLVFEVMTTFNDGQMKTAAEKLKGWFRSCSAMIPELAAKCGERGAKLAGMLK